MNIKWITIMVKNLEESKKFYEEYLGLEQIRSFSPRENMKIVFYADKNGMQIELIEDLTNKNTSWNSNAVSIGIQYDNYDELLELARDMNILESGPIDLGEIECFYVSDPNNVMIQVIKEK